jgi:hypothetical protein
MTLKYGVLITQNQQLVQKMDSKKNKTHALVLTIKELTKKLHQMSSHSPTPSTIAFTNYRPYSPHTTPGHGMMKTSSTSSLLSQDSLQKRSFSPMQSCIKGDVLKSESAIFNNFTKNYDIKKYLS